MDFLKQLVSSLSIAEERLEEAYNQGSYDDFNKIKKFILNIQRRIEVIIGYG